MAVRKERVILELEDRFSNPMLRAAAASATLDKSLNNLDKSTVRTERDMDRLGSPAGGPSKAALQSRTLGREIDRTSGRVRLLTDAALLLGPALIPIGAVGVPALTGLATQFGAAALAGGTAVLAFQGVGDALKAVNEAEIEPTAENLEKARMAMENLSPAAREMVQQLQELRPVFAGLRDAAATGLFPGLSTALDEIVTVLPRVEGVLSGIGDAAGDVAAEFAEGIAGPRGREFLAFLEAEMPSALEELGRTVGNLAAGMGELWMAFTPLNQDFSGWLLDASRGFDDWAQGLSQTQGFRDFVDYIRTNGPRVAEAMGAIGNALLQIVTAAAPLGGPTLAALEAVADVISAIAGSSYGPALIALASGLTLVSRSVKALEALKATSLFSGLTGAADGTSRSLSRMQGAGIAAAAGITTAVVAADGLQKIFAEDLPTMNELTGQLLDLGSGKTDGIAAEFDSLAESIQRITDPSYWKGQQTGDLIASLLGTETRTMANATSEIEALDGALSNLVATAGPGAAEDAFRRLASSQNLSAEQTRNLLQLLPGYRDALAGAENQARITGEASADAGRKATVGFNRAAYAAQQFRNAVSAAREALSRYDAVTAYERAIDDLNKSIRKNGRTLDENTKKGQDNRDALSAAASAAADVAETMKGTNKVGALQRARPDLIDAARKLTDTRAQAAALVDRLLGLDKIRANPRIDADTRAALSGIGVVESRLHALDGQTATVTTYHETVGRVSGRFRPGLADGGTVLPENEWLLASGGVVRGGVTGDRRLAG